MNRRELVLGGIGSIPVGILGYHWRVDTLLDPNWTRARGNSAEVVVSPGGERADEISFERYGSESWESTAEFSTPAAVNYVLERPVEEADPGPTRDIVGLPFGKVVGVSHDTTYDEEGNVVGEPSVSLSELVGNCPSSITVTVETNRREHSTRLPVAISDGTVVQQ